MSRPAHDSDLPPESALRTGLQSLAARLGKTPTVVDLYEDSEIQHHPETYVEIFGSWEQALEAAGLDPDEMGTKKISDLELLAELQRLFQELEKRPTKEDMKEHGQYSDTVYQNRFGTWNDALQSAMLDTSTITESDLINDLQDLAVELERVPTADEMNEYGEYSAVTYHRRFGSWLNALDEAGLLR